MKEQKNLDLIKNFSKIFDFKDNSEQKIPKEDWLGYLDVSGIIMIIPKKNYIKEMIEKNFDVTVQTNPLQNPQSWDYSIEVVSVEDIKKLRVVDRLERASIITKEISSEFNTELFNVILKLCKHSDNIKLKLKPDFPLWAETDDLICIIAPKIDE